MGITLLLIVHITLAAIVFGLPTGMVSAAKRALAAGPEAFRHVAPETERRGKLTSICGILTWLTGLALIFARGGFGTVSTNYHIALTVMLLAIIFSLSWMKPNGGKLVAASQAEPIDTAAAEQALKKLAMGAGILHTTWLILLGLMLFRF